MSTISLRLLIAFSVIIAAYTATLPTAQSYTRTQGWYKGMRVAYYNFVNGNFGDETMVKTAPIWVFRSTNSISATALQKNLIDVVPGDSGYSDLWQVNIVVVNNNQGTIMSKTALDDAVSKGYATINPTSTFVNCPVVGAGSTVEEQDRTKVATVTGFYKGQEVTYFDFGVNPATTLPIWVIKPLSAASPVAMNNIINSVPGDAGYSAFWWVNIVPVYDNYTAQSLTSYAQISSAQTTKPGTFVNCPVVWVDTTVTGNITAAYIAPPVVKSGVMLMISSALVFLMGLILFS